MIDRLSTFFHVNPHHEKSHRQLTDEIRAVAAETRKRTWLNNDIDDQLARDFYLRDARSRLN